MGSSLDHSGTIIVKTCYATHSTIQASLRGRLTMCSVQDSVGNCDVSCCHMTTSRPVLSSEGVTSWDVLITQTQSSQQHASWRRTLRGGERCVAARGERCVSLSARGKCCVAARGMPCDMNIHIFCVLQDVMKLMIDNQMTTQRPKDNYTLILHFVSTNC